MMTSFKRSHARTAVVSAPGPAQATTDLCLHQRLLDTHGHVWASFQWSLILSPVSWCTHGPVGALQESVSPVLCKFWKLYGGVNGNLLQEGLYHTQVYCTQSPFPCSSPLLTHTSSGNTQTLFCLSLCGVSGSWCIQGMSEPSLAGMGFDSKCHFTSPTILLELQRLKISSKKNQRYQGNI